MRIISKFHDYYDGVQSLGQDMYIIYNRTTVDYDETSLPDNVNRVYQQIQKAITPDELFWRWRFPHMCVVNKTHVDLSYGHIIFCGGIYPYIKATHRNMQCEFFYDFKSFDEKYGTSEFRSVKSWYRVLNMFFNVETNNALREVLVEEKAIVMALDGRYVIINPNLKDYQFFRAKPAYEAYQELDSYICGVLTFPHNAMVEIEDKYRIEQHGFDKMSFRKYPTKKK